MKLDEISHITKDDIAEAVNAALSNDLVNFKSLVRVGTKVDAFISLVFYMLSVKFNKKKRSNVGVQGYIDTLDITEKETRNILNQIKKLMIKHVDDHYRPLLANPRYDSKKTFVIMNHIKKTITNADITNK